MRTRASWKELGSIFKSTRSIIFLFYLVFVTPNVIIALNENETFESAFGLNSPESIENHDTAKQNELLLAKEPETSLETEDLDVEQKDITSTEKKVNEESLFQILPKTENAIILESGPKESPLSIQSISVGKTDERIGKYVRYGK